MEASHAESSSRADDLSLRLLETRSFIHSTLSLEYGLVDKPREPQSVFRCLQTEVAVKKEELRVATVEVGILQAILDTERQSSTSSPTLKRELVWL